MVVKVYGRAFINNCTPASGITTEGTTRQKRTDCESTRELTLHRVFMKRLVKNETRSSALPCSGRLRGLRAGRYDGAHADAHPLPYSPNRGSHEQRRELGCPWKPDDHVRSGCACLLSLSDQLFGGSLGEGVFSFIDVDITCNSVGRSWRFNRVFLVTNE